MSLCGAVLQVFSEISARSSNCTNPAQLRQLVPQPVVVGLFRDLRGIATATSTRRTYSLLFDWLVSCPRNGWIKLFVFVFSGGGGGQLSVVVVLQTRRFRGSVSTPVHSNGP